MNELYREPPRRPRTWLTVLDYVFILRPVLLIPPWTLLLLGYFWGSRGGFPGAGWPVRLPSGSLLLALVTYSLLLGGIYILNQVYDRETDRANRKVFFLSGGLVPLPAAIFEALALLVVSFFLTLRFALSFRALVFCSLVLGLLYCTPPVKLKSKPVVDLLSNAVGYGFLAFATGWVLTAGLSTATLQQSLPYILAVGGVFCLTTIPDIPGDRASGNLTTGVWLGAQKTALLAATLLGGSLAVALLLHDYVCSFACLLGLPFFILAATRTDVPACLRAEWVGGLSLVLIAGVLYPWFLLVLAATFLCLKRYYSVRFGLRYPF